MAMAMAMAMAKLKLKLKLLLLLLLLPFLFLLPALCAPTSSFSFPSFDFSSLPSLLFHGDTRLSLPPCSAVQLSGSSPNSSGGFFFSRPIPMSASLSFSSSFSFSFDLLHRDSRDSLSFVVTAVSTNAALPFEVLASVQLDSLLDRDRDREAYSSDLRAGMLQAFVEYNGARKEIEVRLSEPGTPPPATPMLSYHVDLGQNLFVYVGFMASTGSSKQQKERKTIHTWNFNTWDASEHSIPVDPAGPHHPGHNLLVENAYVRAMTLLVGAVLCASVSAVALWALVERALGSSRRELAMLPVLCDYEQVAKDRKEGDLEEKPLMMAD